MGEVLRNLGECEYYPACALTQDYGGVNLSLLDNVVVCQKTSRFFSGAVLKTHCKMAGISKFEEHTAWDVKDVILLLLPFISLRDTVSLAKAQPKVQSRECAEGRWYMEKVGKKKFSFE